MFARLIKDSRGVFLVNKYAINGSDRCSGFVRKQHYREFLERKQILGRDFALHELCWVLAKLITQETDLTQYGLLPDAPNVFPLRTPHQGTLVSLQFLQEIQVWRIEMYELKFCTPKAYKIFQLIDR